MSNWWEAARQDPGAVPWLRSFFSSRYPRDARNALGAVDEKFVTDAVAAGGGGGAPTTAQYITAATDPTLTAERVLTNTATVTWDFSTAGQAKANAAAGGGGNVSNSGTPTVGQYAKWTDATHVQGVAPATVLSDIGAAPLASPVFTGDPKAPTPTAGDNDTSIATTAFVAAAVSASDDVLEFANLAAFPATGVAGIIYVALDTNKIYRWSAAVAATTIWNTADKSAGVALSGGSLTATASGGNQGVRATVGASTGKLYFEVSYTSSSGYFGLGLASMPFNATTNAAGVAPSSGWIQVNGSSTINIGGLTSPVGIAVDLAAKRIWFRAAPSGNWNGNATYNPATNVGGVDISALSGTFFPMATALAASNDATGNFGATAFSGAVPAGFSSWNNAGGAPAYVEISPGSGGGTPGGSDTQVQYNNSGAFGGAANLTWNNGTNVLTVAGSVVLPSTGSQTATSINFGFVGTGVYGAGSQINFSTSSTQRLSLTNTDLTSTVRFSAPVGSALAASYHFGTSNTGLYGPSSGTAVAITIGGANKLTLNATDLTSQVPITLPGNPTANLHAATKQYVDTFAPLASPTFTGDPKAPTPTAGDNDTSIATTAFVTAAVAAGGGGGSATPGPPQGRLTLNSSLTVMTTTHSAKTSIYYLPHVGSLVPIYNGASFVMTAITTLTAATTDTTKSPAAIGASKVNDWFVWNDAGTIRVGHGPDWTNDTTRADAIMQVNGTWVNQATITNGPAAQRGTFVGTTRSNASSQLDWIFGGLAAGGTAGFFGVANAYNQVEVRTLVSDSTDSWTYGTATWRASNAAGAGSGLNMRVSYIDPLGTATVAARNYGYISHASGFSVAGIGVDTTTAFSGTTATVGAAIGTPACAEYAGIPGPGFHFVQAIEYATAGAAGTFRGDNGTPAYLQTGMWVGFRA